MLAWLGGKRRLVKQQKARRRLMGVFDKQATKRKPTTLDAARNYGLMDAVLQRFTSLSTRSDALEPSLNPPSKIKTPAPLDLSTDGISLDILALSGAHTSLTTSFSTPTVAKDSVKSQIPTAPVKPKIKATSIIAATASTSAALKNAKTSILGSPHHTPTVLSRDCGLEKSQTAMNIDEP